MHAVCNNVNYNGNNTSDIIINTNIISLISQNQKLLQQLTSTNTENIILKQKIIMTLSKLIEHHKSKHEQLSAQLQCEIAQQKDKHHVKITALNSQIQDQSVKITAFKQEISSLKQQSIDTDDKHKKKIEHFQLEMHHQMDIIDNIRYQTTATESEITSLNKQLFQKDIDMKLLQKQLLNAQNQSLQYVAHIPSPSTVHITKSKSSFNFEKHHSELSVQLQPIQIKTRKWTDQMHQNNHADINQESFGIYHITPLVYDSSVDEETKPSFDSIDFMSMRKAFESTKCEPTPLISQISSSRNCFSLLGLMEVKLYRIFVL